MPNEGKVCGETQMLQLGVVQCRIAFELLEPLFDSRVTAAKRILSHFYVARTALHELTVNFYPPLAC